MVTTLESESLSEWDVIVRKLNLKEPRSGWNLDSKRSLQYVKQKKKRKKKELKKKADFDRERVSEWENV